MSAPTFVRALLVWCGGALLAAAALAQGVVSTPTRQETVVEATSAREAAQVGDRVPARVVVIPVRDEIAKPVLYVIRRGLKEAIEQQADLVLFDMKTPGGSLGVTFEILAALEKFQGETATFVNNEAISAGSFISAMTDDIYFTPDGVIGAAAPVQAGGQDIDETMKLKVVSYLRARIRAISEGHGFRGQVISAMIDADYELKIGDEVLKAKGELLSLTASEASKAYGDPAQPLLAAGIAKSVDALLDARYGVGGYTVTRLETSWSEDLAAVLNAMSPILMGLGVLGLFIEFKTPGFGIFGIGGGLLLLIVFFGHYVAGLSGHEPMLFFALGLVLVLVELLLFPGVIVLALGGVVLMLGSLVWSMADLWPNQPISLSGDAFVQPIISLALSLLVATVGAVVVLRFLPRGWFWDKMILATAAGGRAVALRDTEGTSVPVEALVGKIGVTMTAMYPTGQVKIDGRWYEARVQVGSLEAGRQVVVREKCGFNLVVAPTGATEDNG